jgi:guanosine-3',5'-bis(diphosphate) 3'-pyrophosphohydrolase
MKRSSQMIIDAERIATDAHASQMRKYTWDAYIVHPKAVADIVADVTDDPVTIAAAWLHDVVEDTHVTLDQIRKHFGWAVAGLVENVTNVTCKEDGNREMRKALERAHLAKAHPKAQTIKLADILDNVPSIVRYDPGFAVTYVEEKRLVLNVLRKGNATLWHRAKQLIEESQEQLA